jgi:hypothetical protein
VGVGGVTLFVRDEIEEPVGSLLLAGKGTARENGGAKPSASCPSLPDHLDEDRPSLLRRMPAQLHAVAIAVHILKRNGDAYYVD